VCVLPPGSPAKAALIIFRKYVLADVRGTGAFFLYLSCGKNAQKNSK